MKVAFATTDGNTVDEHFGRAGSFAIYEIMDSGYRFVELRKFADGVDQSLVNTKDKGQVHDDAVKAKVDKLADCKLIYITEIGGPSAARLVQKGIMPLKMKEPIQILSALEQLDNTLKNSPPPWLRKAMSE